MAQLAIKNFRFGLDSRRSELTAQVGTLVTLNNAYINEGGEIHQRKAFVPYALPAGCFGLQDTSLGLTTFGSTDPAATITDALSTLSTAMGKTIVYKRLQHPVLSLTGSTENLSLHAMTTVKWSKQYKGYALVAATFADGNTFLYYNGTVIASSWVGKVLNGGSVAVGNVGGWATPFALVSTQSETLKSQLQANLSTWNVQYSPLEYVSGFYNNFSDFSYTSMGVITPSSAETAPTFSKVSSSSGQLNLLPLTTQTAVSGVAATASVTITGSAGDTYQLWAATGSPYTNLAETNLLWSQTTADIVVDWTTSNDNTASLINAAVNANTAITGYSSTVLANVLTISSPIVTGTVAKFSYPGTEVRGTYTPTSLLLHRLTGPSTLVTTACAFTGGLQSYPGAGLLEQYAFYGKSTAGWAVGDTWTLTVTTTAGTDYTLGLGRIGYKNFSSAFIYGDRAFLSNGQNWNFSEVGDVTKWEIQNAGAGEINYQSQYGSVDTVQTFGIYQSSLAVFGTQTIQLWTVGADPATSLARTQTLTNIGTSSPDSVGNLGELDLVFLAASGFRSLQARVTTLSAVTQDLGSPIDSLVQATLTASTPAQIANVCSVVESGSNRYWAFVKDTMYVYSSFASSKINAWSTFSPTYRSGYTLTLLTGTKGTVYVDIRKSDGSYYQVATNFSTSLAGTATALAADITSSTATHGCTATANGTIVTISGLAYVKIPSQIDFTTSMVALSTTFAPKKFVVYQNQIFATDDAYIYQYGGKTGNSFDGSVVTWELPWLDLGKPQTIKSTYCIDVAMTGSWKLEAGTTAAQDTLETIFNYSGSFTAANELTDSPFDGGSVPFISRGSHVKVKGTSNSLNDTQVKFGCLVVNYEDEEVK